MGTNDELGTKGLLAGAMMWPFRYRWSCHACRVSFSERDKAIAHAKTHRDLRAERRRQRAGAEGGESKGGKREVISIIVLMIGLVFLLGPPAYLLLWLVESTTLCGADADLYFPPTEGWKYWLLALAWFNAIPMFAASAWLGRDKGRLD